MRAIWSRYNAARSIARSPSWNAERTRPGMVVQASGTALGRSALIAPFSGRECVLYVVQLREWDDGTLFDFMTVVSSAPFYLCTATAKLLFDPVHCEAHIKGPVEKGETINSQSRTAAFFDDHFPAGIPNSEADPSKTQGSRRSFQWKERVVRSGDQVRVAGTLSSLRDITGRATYREPPTRPSIGHPEAVLIV